MRRICRGSSFRLAARVARPAASAVLGVALLLGTPGLAGAEPSGSSDSLSALIAEVAKANQHLEDLRGAIEAEQESVNKALVDVQTARDNAAAAQHDVEVSQRAVKDANAAIAAAQRRFDAFAAATYVNGPSNSYLTAAGPDDIIATASAGRTLAASSRQVMANLQRARTEQVNKESAARLAKQKADRAAAEAQARQDAAVSALTAAHRKFGEQQAEVNRLAAERDAAQARLEAARTWSAPGGGTQAGSRSRDRWIQGAGKRTAERFQAVGRRVGSHPADGAERQCSRRPDRDHQHRPGYLGDVVAGHGQHGPQLPAEAGHPQTQRHRDHQRPHPAGVRPAGIRIRDPPRALAAGVPYSWGGGTAAGPSRGIGSGADTVGFDCSGLILYSFAGVGIKLPHYSGSQYNLGRKIPSAQMRRGDVIFYGPGGSQHVTLYLGDGQMLEAPDVGLRVRVAPVRTSGMTPYVVRYIEF